MTTKRVSPCKYGIQHNTKCPNIYGRPMELCLPPHNLWRHKARCPTTQLQLLRVWEHSRKPEINNSYCLSAMDKNVVQLEVSMCYLLTVSVLHNFNNLAKDGLARIFRDPAFWEFLHVGI
jgi:hypothetical protein